MRPRPLPLSLLDFALRDVPPVRLGGSEPVVGRYRAPVPNPDVEAQRASKRGLKQWHYQSFTTPDWFLGFATVQLGYVAQLFAYFVDRRTHERVEMERVSLLGRALRFSPSSLAGTTRWSSRGVSLTMGFDGSHFVRFDLPLDAARLTGEVHCAPDEALALVFPLASGRLAYTHKAAAMRACGSLHLGTRELKLTDALANLDYTRSIARRHTEWNWASFAGQTQSGKRFGLNLSAHVYDIEGASMENALWLDGRVHTLGAVRFEVPAKTTDSWHIESSDGSGEVRLDVRPMGERRSDFDLTVFRSVFAQPYGQATGTVRGERVEGVFGVVENHDALW